MTVPVRHIDAAPPVRDHAALDAAARALVLRALRRLHGGELTVHEESGPPLRFGEMSGRDPVRASVRVHRASVYRSLLSGSLGVAMSYADSAWDSDDLVALVRLVSRNLNTIDRVAAAAAPLLRPLRATREWVLSNTRARSRDNIAQHYDIGNDLFELMLDPTMSYSAAIFDSAASTLEQASLAKIERLCDKLQLGPDDHLVEIGTGWGGLAVHAARRHGCRVTTTTISREQHDLACRRVQEAGVGDLVTVLLSDYRDLRGRFTKLVSVEMIEAIGWRQYGTFFDVCSRLLDDEGVAAIQAICQPHATFLRMRGVRTFMSSQIFPGGICPSDEALLGAARATGQLRLVNLEDITPGYPLTLAAWRENLERNADRLPPRLDQRFRRAWVLYLSLCEAAFTERRISDVQMLFAKPGFRAEPLPRWRPAGEARTVTPATGGVAAAPAAAEERERVLAR